MVQDGRLYVLNRKNSDAVEKLRDGDVNVSKK